LLEARILCGRARGARQSIDLGQDLGGVTHAVGPPLDRRIVGADAFGLSCREQARKVRRALSFHFVPQAVVCGRPQAQRIVPVRKNQ
jgi:hypothetical protein